MLKMLTLLGCLTVAALLCLPQLAAAGPVPYDGEVTLAPGEMCVTQDVALTAGSYDIDRIVFYNSGAVTSAVAVSASDRGVFTTVASYALAATGGSCQWPRRKEIAHTTTNNYPYTCRDLRVIAYKNTNASDVVIFYRIFYPDN